MSTDHAARILGATLFLAGCGSDSPAPHAGPPPPVITETATLRDLATERSFTGRIEAIDKVSIRARVQGFLKARHFEEGADVRAGALLYEIDPEPFETAVRQAEANLASARAAELLAQQTFDRVEELAGRGSSTRAQLDQARATLQQAQANVKAREADLTGARTNLGYARITAPMDGRVGRAAFSVGNLVGPDSGALVTLVKQDPVYVTFPVPTALLLQVQKAGEGPDSVYIKLRLADGSTYEPVGEIAFGDIQATAGTDSITIRARIANPARLLVDQQLVQVNVISRKPEHKLLISQTALLLDQQGAYVFTVDAASKAQIRRIVVGEQRGPMLVVDGGLAAGDVVITSGQQRVRPGAPVSAQPAAPALAAPKS